MLSSSRNSILVAIFSLTLLSNSLLANKIKIPKSLKNGPQKNWSSWKYDRYYNWRNKLVKRLHEQNNDDQILRRQKAILNGNKITTEIWNYGSISSPGNRVTDIIWEGLGYGYEFGPMICAEIPILSRSHEDAFPKISTNGDTTWYVNAISGSLWHTTIATFHMLI